MTGTKFKEYFKTEEIPAIFNAPGRVNLIGEHTDYNGGFVLPMGIDFATTIAIRLREDNKVRAYSENLDSLAEFCINDPFLLVPAKKQWFYYIAGVLQVLESKGFALKGADIYINSSVPIGSGLSSSASLEVVIGYAFLNLLGYPIDLIELAKTCQQAEHEYAGTKCGIMDQYICAMAEKNHALLIDCFTLEAVKVPMKMEHAIFVICDTGVHHNLGSSEYNVRRAQCEEVAHYFGVNSLRALPHEDFIIPPLGGKQFRRAAHVFAENQRVLDAVTAMKTGNLSTLGRLMTKSHRSLQRNYEVSCQELDFLVEAANNLPYVYGARMTGGGFGGCTVNLIQKDFLEEFTNALKRDYAEQMGRKLKVYVSEPAGGVKRIQ